MTAIKPIENRRVRAVASERYPLNKVCAHPECTEPAVDPHHAFPRSAIGGDSWFVEIVIEHTVGSELMGNGPTLVDEEKIVIPHVTGLCRAHHDEVEEHTAWIQLDEESGVWVWNIQVEPTPEEVERWVEATGEHADAYPVDCWEALGPLNPQPGSKEGKPKTRKRLQGDARRKRRTISIKVPNDTEDGGALWDEMLGNVKSKLVAMELYDENDEIPNYEALMAATNDWLTS